MATSFDKTRNAWRYNFQRGGKRYANLCRDDDGNPVNGKRAAQAAERREILAVEAKLKAAKAVRVPRDVYTVAEMLRDFATQKAIHNASWKSNIRKYVQEIKDFFGAANPASSITLDKIEEFIAHSRATPRMINIGGQRIEMIPTDHLRSDSTTNRHLATLRAAINWAAKRGTMTPVWVRRLDEPEAHPNPVAPEEVTNILGVSPYHLRVAIILAASTGMRLDETLGLTTDHVDLPNRVIRLSSDETKAGKAQVVYINDDLANVIQEVIEALPAQCKHLVHYRGGPVKNVKKAWAGALKAAKVPHHRFHDLRATFCTALAKDGQSALNIQRAARHASYQTTLRYLKAHDEDLRRAFEATSAMQLRIPKLATDCSDEMGRASNPDLRNPLGMDHDVP